MRKKTYSLAEIKKAHKKAGLYFFDKGLPPVISKKGNFLITRGMGGGFVLYKFDPKTARITYVKSSKTKGGLL